MPITRLINESLALKLQERAAILRNEWREALRLRAIRRLLNASLQERAQEG